MKTETEADAPLVKGGQGRTEDEVVDSATSIVSGVLWSLGGAAVIGLGSWICVTALCGCAGHGLRRILGD